MTTTPEPGPTAPVPTAPHPAQPQPQPLPAQAAAVDGPPQEQPGRVRRRWSRGRLALLIGGAAVLGVLGGGGLGYAVQAGRPPTPLPPLAGDPLHYPLAHATASPAPLPADQDDAVRTDGDLTALLVPAPSGSKPWEQPDTPDGWLSPAGFAVGYKQPAGEFRWLLQNGFRRAAEAEWMQGDTSYQVVLMQFQKENESNAATELTAQQGYAKSYCGGNTATVPGTTTGVVDAGTNSHTDSGGNTYYQGRGFAQHGDILVEIYATGPGQVSASSVMSVLQSQLERL